MTHVGLFLVFFKDYIPFLGNANVDILFSLLYYTHQDYHLAEHLEIKCFKYVIFKNTSSSPIIFVSYLPNRVRHGILSQYNYLVRSIQTLHYVYCKYVFAFQKIYVILDSWQIDLHVKRPTILSNSYHQQEKCNFDKRKLDTEQGPSFKACSLQC